MVKLKDPVQWKLKNGSIAKGLISELRNDIAKVQIIRAGELSTDCLEIPVKFLRPGTHLRKADPGDLVTAIKSPTQFGPPTDKQLEQIREMQPLGAKPAEKEDVIVFPVHSLNNLINKNGYQISVQAIKDFANLSPGIPFIKDHGRPNLFWSDLVVDDIWARQLGVQVVKGNEPHKRQIEFGGNGKENRKILEKEGYVQAIVTAYGAAGNEMINSAELGLKPGTSVGGMYFDGVTCPLCDCHFGENDCNHIIPVYGKRTADIFDVDESRVAPYWTFDRMTAVSENSSVVNPAIVGAGIITHKVV